MVRRIVSYDPLIQLTRRNAVRSLIQAWGQVSLMVLARTWGLRSDPKEGDKGIDDVEG
jgi:hypothetical protein